MVGDLLHFQRQGWGGKTVSHNHNLVGSGDCRRVETHFTLILVHACDAGMFFQSVFGAYDVHGRFRGVRG